MKSPVNGTNRNRKRAKTYWPAAGSVKMKGKKVKRMSCGCCTCIDKREKILEGIETKEFSRGVLGDVNYDL